MQPVSSQKASSVLMALSYALGAVGIYFGFHGGPNSLKWFCLLAVGAPTAAGFVRHFFLWRGDAARLGFETTDPSWMWEVAFANLALAIGAVLAAFSSWGRGGQLAVVVVMGCYMLGATAVHLVSWLHKPAGQRNSPIMHIGLPLAYAVILLIVGFTS